MDEGNLETTFFDDKTAAEILRKERDKDPRSDVCPKLIEQITIDEKIAIWRKNWCDNNGCYNQGVDMPPPLYDEDLAIWRNGNAAVNAIDFSKIDKQRLLKFYNAEQLVKNIEENEAARKRFEETMKRLEEWYQSDDYKEFKARMDAEYPDE